MRKAATVGWRFIRELLIQATIAGSWPTRVAKIAGAVITVIVGFTADSVVRISVAKKAGDSPVEVMSPSLGLLIALAVGAVWLSVAIGRAGVGFKNVKHGEAIEVDPFRNYYRLSVVNKGWFDADVHAYAVDIADASGRVFNPQLPIELNWMHERQGSRPKLSRGVPRKVDVFFVIPESCRNEPDGTWSCTAAFTGLNNIYLTIGAISSKAKNKLWIAVAIDHYESVTWFAIEAAEEAFQLRVTAEKPPCARSVREKFWKKILAILNYPGESSAGNDPEEPNPSA